MIDIYTCQRCGGMLAQNGSLGYCHNCINMANFEIYEQKKAKGRMTPIDIAQEAVDAYPVSVFPELSDKQLQEIDRLLKKNGYDL